jgi:ABC-type transport system involved in multi-copper enzyme maturation permease subunit
VGYTGTTSMKLNEYDKEDDFVFREKIPDQFINAGISEQNIIGIAAGLQKEGFNCFVYSIASFIMLFAVPLLTMRLISEERRSQTLPFLFSAPISLTEIVLGKFVGLIVFLSIEL